jgi:hypothetical protein
MRFHFGLHFAEGTLPAPATPTRGERAVGPRQLLSWLERALGLSVPDEQIEHLRTEQYRQALRQHLTREPAAFFAAAFRADDLATAATLLQRRDELLLAGWDFALQPGLPDRLRVLAEVHDYFRQAGSPRLSPGLADRQVAVIAALPRLPQRPAEIVVYDAFGQCPPDVQRLLQALELAGIPLRYETGPAPEGEHDLAHWQRFLSGQARPRPLRADGSLLILQARRETHLAAYLARLLRRNADFRPNMLLPQANRTLDNALIQEGLPSLGVASSSLARPSLQVLKLAPVFLWEPLDPYKVMEFVSLGIKPLDDGLASRIAAFLAETPGLFSDRWFAMVNQYLNDELPQRAQRRPELDADEARRQYEFWFRRRRADSTTGQVDKPEVREVFDHLREWALRTHARHDDHPPTLLVLASQAGRIVDLLDELPETSLRPLDLERIVRTIYEPAPVTYRPAEANRLDSLHHPGAFRGPVAELVWWDFVAGDPDYFFSHWYPPERQYLQAHGIILDDPARQNARLVAQRKRPVQHTRQRLILCLPGACDGREVAPHPLFGDLQACFGEDLQAITLDVDAAGAAPKSWAQAFRLPTFTTEEPHPLPPPRPFLEVRDISQLPARETETPTSLEALLYYPYQWFFRHKIRLRQSSILTVVPDSRLFGNLAHRFLERLLEAAEPHWTRTDVEQWINREAEGILRKEGATLLLYGREPERIKLINQLKYAAWSLLSLLQANNWQVQDAELELEGHFGDIPLRGRADLVLRRGEEKAVIDLKWRGRNHHAELLRNAEDIQLALYAELLPPAGRWAQTAYFIISQGEMLVRDTRAFREVPSLVADASPEEIYNELKDRILRTYHWRQQQLGQGQIEIRCGATEGELEDHYGEDLLDLLEMRTGDARYDDYRVLIGLVR